MPPLNLPLMVFGRPVKPVALGLVVICLTLTWSNIVDIGVFGQSRWGDLLGVVCALSVVLFMAGWWGRSQALAEHALLAVSAAMIFRSLGLLFEQGFMQQSVYLSIGVATIAVGSYVLERLDPRGRPTAGG